MLRHRFFLSRQSVFFVICIRLLLISDQRAPRVLVRQVPEQQLAGLGPIPDLSAGQRMNGIKLPYRQVFSPGFWAGVVFPQPEYPGMAIFL